MARRFTFRFETMLKIRRQREDQHKRIVGDRLGQITQVEEQAGALNRQIQEEMAAIRAGQEVGRIDMQQVIRHRHWLGHLHKGVLEAEARKRFLEAKLAQERVLLAEAAKQRRILEKLKEHRWAQHRYRENRQETLAADEMAIIRHVFDRADKGEPVGV